MVTVMFSVHQMTAVVDKSVRIQLNLSMERIIFGDFQASFRLKYKIC